MPNFSYASDLEVLVAIFASNTPNLVVFDPGDTLQWDIPNTFSSFTNSKDLVDHLQVNTDQDFFVFNLSEFDIDSLFSIRNVHVLIQNQSNKSKEAYQRFFYINNPSGTMRWIYPDSVSIPSFLNLYNSSGWRSELYRLAASLVFAVGGREWFSSGSFVIRSKHILHTNQLLKGLAYDHYTLFTGTTSASRKAILEVNKNEESKWFLKIPIGKEAHSSLQNEKETLEILSECDLKSSHIPMVLPAGVGVLLENIKPKECFKSVQLEDIHLKALLEWYKIETTHKAVKETDVFKEVQKHLRILQGFSGDIELPMSKPKVQAIIQKLVQLNEQFQNEKPLALAWAHGDFTPWNLYCHPTKIHVYDWEMARSKMPLLFDAFHFIFQAGILIKGFNWDQIARELETFQGAAFVQTVERKYHIDFTVHLQFYLLYTVSYYLSRYLCQQPLHQQAGWLVNTWEEALNTIVESAVLEKSDPTAISVASLVEELKG